MRPILPLRGLLRLATLLALGCGATSDREAIPSATVSLSLSPELQPSRLTIAGATDLPNGAILLYEARHENWAAAGEPIWLRSGQLIVQGGRFSESLRLRTWPPGRIEVWVSFQTVLPAGSQPPDVLTRFGQMGEHLTGENVTQTGPMKRVEVAATVAPEG